MLTERNVFYHNKLTYSVFYCISSNILILKVSVWSLGGLCSVCLKMWLCWEKYSNDLAAVELNFVIFVLTVLV